MGYNIYDEIAELINLSGEVSLENGQEEGKKLSIFIQECVNDLKEK